MLNKIKMINIMIFIIKNLIADTNTINRIKK